MADPLPAPTPAEARGRTLIVEVPAGGRSLTVPVDPGATVELRGLDPATATLERQGEALVVALPGGASVVLEHFFGPAGSAVVVIDGVPVAAASVAGALEAPFAIEPAAGPATADAGPATPPGSGANFNPNDPGAIGEGLAVKPLLDPTGLAFSVPEPDAGLVPDDDDGGGDDGGGGDPARPLVVLGNGTETTTIEISRTDHVPDPATPVFAGDLLVEGRPIDPATVRGITHAGNLTLAGDAEVTVAIVSENAGYRNTVGWYAIEDGAIVDPKILFANASLAGSGGTLAPGDTVSLGVVPAGTQLGMFLIADGWSSAVNRAAIASGEPLRVEGGRIFAGATELQGAVYFSHDPALGSDGQDHLLAGVSSDRDGFFYVGWEDLFASGDEDFNDVVFRVDLGEFNLRNVTAETSPVTVALADVDSDQLASASVRASLLPGDALVFDASRLGTIAATPVVEGGVVIGYDFSGPADIAAYEALLESVQIAVDRFDPTQGARSLSVSVTDDTGLTSEPRSADFTVDVRDSPAGGSALAYVDPPPAEAQL
jgi:hypothetical protein